MHQLIAGSIIDKESGYIIEDCNNKLLQAIGYDKEPEKINELLNRKVHYVVMDRSKGGRIRCLLDNVFLSIFGPVPEKQEGPWTYFNTFKEAKEYHDNQLPSGVKSLIGMDCNNIKVHGFLTIKKTHATWLVRCSNCENLMEMSSPHINAHKNNNRQGCQNCKSILHGDSSSKLYRLWKYMITKCTNENDRGYQYFGAKGITVCKRWEEYLNFKEDVLKNYSEGFSLKLKTGENIFKEDNCYWYDSKIKGKVRI